MIQEPALYGISRGAMRRAEPSIFDRVLNPTLGVLQQPLWRITRALKQGDPMSILSKEGLLDPALLPLAGVLFSQKNAVMAEELFGKNTGAQIAGSILTDPFSYMTSLPTAAAKGAKALAASQGTSKGAKLVALSKQKHLAYAAEQGMKIDENVLLQGIQREATELASGELVPTRAQFNQMLGHLDLGDVRKGAAGELPDLIAATADLPDDMPLAEVLSKRKDRVMALGVPVLGDLFGMSVAAPQALQEKYGSWFKAYGAATKGFYKMGAGAALLPPRALLAFAGKEIQDIPVIGAASQRIVDIGSEFGQGLKRGRVSPASIAALHTLEGAKGGKEMEPREIERYLNLDVMPMAGRAKTIVQKRGSSQPLLDVDTGSAAVDDLAKFVAGVDFTSTPNEWELVDEISQALLGKTFDPEKFPAFQQDLIDAIKQIPGKQARAEGLFADVGPVFDMAEGMPQTWAAKLGYDLSRFQQLLFKNDIGVQGGEVFTKHRNKLHIQTTALIQEYGRAMRSKFDEVIEETGLDPDAAERIFLHLEGLNPSAQEMSRLKALFNSGSGTERAIAYQELQTYWTGHIAANLHLMIGELSRVNGDTPAFKAALDELTKSFSAFGAQPLKGSTLDMPLRINAGGQATFEQHTPGVGWAPPGTEELTTQSARITKAEGFNALDPELAIPEGLASTTKATAKTDVFSTAAAEISGELTSQTKSVAETQLALTDADASDLTKVIRRLSARKSVLDEYFSLGSELGSPLGDVPVGLADGILEDVADFSDHVNKLVLGSMGKAGQDFFEFKTRLKAQLFSIADRSGALGSAVPLGYIHRTQAFESLSKAMVYAGNAINSSERGNMHPYVSSLFTRGRRNWTIPEINAVSQELLSNPAPAAAEAHAQLQTALKEAGLDLKELSDSPIDTALAHMSDLREFHNHSEYFKTVFGKGGQTAKDALKLGLVGGRVEDVIVHKNARTAPRMVKLSNALEGGIKVGENNELLANSAAHQSGNISQDSYSWVVRMENGERVFVPMDLLNSGFSLNVVGKGNNIDEAVGSFLGDPMRNTPSGVASFLRSPPTEMAQQQIGKYVTVAPEAVNKSIFREMEHNAPAGLAGLLKTYDALHAHMKVLATALRFPLQFHTSNLISAYPQMMLEGVGPTHTAQGMWLTARLMSSTVDDVIQHDEMTALLKSSDTGKVGQTPSGNWLASQRTGFELKREARRRAGTAGFFDPATFKDDVPEILEIGDRKFHVRDILDAMMEHGALDTQTAEELRNMTSVPDMVFKMRQLFHERGVAAAGGQLREKALEFTESSEFFARMSGMLGGLSAGLDLDSAARSVSTSMVDYGDLTKLERQLAKRLVFFYVFPRKMIPTVLRKGTENPATTAAFLHTALGSSLLSTDEGRFELKKDEYRVNLSRLAPQFDAPIFLASMADILPMDVRKYTGEGEPDRAFTPAGPLSVAGWSDFFPMQDPLKVNGSWLDQASRATWIMKLFTSGPKSLLGSNDPRVQYTPLELSAQTLLPFRKVRPNQEETRKRYRLKKIREDLMADYQREIHKKQPKRAAVIQRAIQRVDEQTQFLASRGGEGQVYL